jgi:hypothetical protein
VGELFVKYYTKGVNVKKRLYTKEGELQTCLIIMKEKYLILLWGGSGRGEQRYATILLRGIDLNTS